MSIELIKDIYDKFVYDGTEYVVLNDRMSHNTELNKKLILGKVRIKDSIKEIIPLMDQEEYDEVVKYYIDLKLAFQKESIK